MSSSGSMGELYVSGARCLYVAISRAANPSSRFCSGAISGRLRRPGPDARCGREAGAGTRFTLVQLGGEPQETFSNTRPGHTRLADYRISSDVGVYGSAGTRYVRAKAVVSCTSPQTSARLPVIRPPPVADSMMMDDALVAMSRRRKDAHAQLMARDSAVYRAMVSFPRRPRSSSRLASRW